MTFIMLLCDPVYIIIVIFELSDLPFYAVSLSKFSKFHVLIIARIKILIG